MNSILLAIQSAIAQGIIWGIMALGVYMTFRILDFPDLTVDGSFATGGAICAVSIVQGMDPILAILMATIGGFLAGFITGFLHTKCNIPAILAGILTQLGLYSINLRIMGRSNLPLLKESTLFKNLTASLGIDNTIVTIIIGGLFVALVIFLCYWFFGTEIGSAVRATGNNPRMVTAQGGNINTTKMLGLMIANGLVALSGALVTQSQGSSDVKMGTGAIVIGLASIVIGEVVFGKKGNFAVRLLSIIVGSIIYRIIVAVVLQMGLNTDDLKLLTALLVALALTIPYMLDKRKQVSLYKKLTGKEFDNVKD